MEVVDACFEERLMFIALDVLGDIASAALGVTHFSKDETTRAGDAFDGEGALVWVLWLEHGGLATREAVLSCDLALGDQGVEGGLVGEESPFSVRDGNGVEVSRLTVAEPR